VFNSLSNLEEGEDLDVITLIGVLNTTVDRYVKGREEKWKNPTKVLKKRVLKE
jgi:hypothetical protein